MEDDMPNIVEYSSKSVAIRGLSRMGVTDKNEAEKFVQVTKPANPHDTSPTKYLVDKDAVNAALAAKKRGAGVVLSDADKKQIKDEARDRGAIVTDSAAEQMTQDEIDSELAVEFGYSHCPACEVHLSNGVMDFESLADQKGDKEAYALQKHQFSCMGCNAEWGDEGGPA